MLASVARGGEGFPGSAGHPRVTTAPGFASMSVLQRANQARIDHAAASLPRNEKKKKKRGAATRPPTLNAPSSQPTIEECVTTAQGGEQVVNLDFLVYPPRPSPLDMQV